MKTQRKVISLAISAFLLISAFGGILSVNAEGNNLGTEEATQIDEDVEEDDNLPDEEPLEENDKKTVIKRASDGTSSNEVKPLAEDDNEQSLKMIMNNLQKQQ